MWVQAIIFAAALILAPLTTRAADLVIWWQQGFYTQEDEAVAEMLANPMAVLDDALRFLEAGLAALRS